MRRLRILANLEKSFGKEAAARGFIFIFIFSRSLALLGVRCIYIYIK